MSSLLTKKVNIIYVFLAALVVGGCSYLTAYKLTPCNKDIVLSSEEINNSTDAYKSCEVTVKRMKGYNYIRPLMFVDKGCESEEFTPLKNELDRIIENYKQQSQIISASVYLKEYDQNSWMGINDEEKYKPGSLLKIPELITYLRMSESNPGLLERRILYDKKITTIKNPRILSNSIQVGKTYTVRELLKYMIKYSDNNATIILNNLMDHDMFKKTFTDFGLPVPDMKQNNYPISARDVSLFMRALYNGCYLSKNNSEYATELLGLCDFKNGIVNGLPQGTRIAHKFGEAGNDLGLELHESAIVYINNTAYLLTVMTKGNDMETLPEVISSISSKVYGFMNKKTKYLNAS